jgi:hypothetical protein
MPAVMEAPAEPLAMSDEDSWAQATREVVGAISGSGRVQDLHAAAAGQIDAADYSLRSLIAELSFAMPIPADGSALRALLAEVADFDALAEQETLAA